MLDINEIARETALKSGTLLGKDDPILISVSINEKVLGHYAGQLRQEQVQQQKDLAVLIEKHTEQAKDATSLIITRAGHFVHDQVLKATAQVGELVGKDVRAEGLTLQRELEAFRAKFVSQVHTIQWLMFGLSLLASALVGVLIGMNI